MIPGLWLEIEVIGINCPLARKLPDDWFFLRDGQTCHRPRAVSARFPQSGGACTCGSRSSNGSFGNSASDI